VAIQSFWPPNPASPPKSLGGLTFTLTLPPPKNLQILHLTGHTPVMPAQGGIHDLPYITKKPNKNSRLQK
jgi:hypothetical protein